MGKKSIFQKAAALFMAAALGISAAGCGTKELPEDPGGTQAGVMDISQPDTGQTDPVHDSGMGRYVETTVYEGKGFSDLVQTQSLSDGQIVFLNCLTRQRVVSKDGGSIWESEPADAFFGFIDDHYAAAAAIAKDGTIAVIGMDHVDSSSDGEDGYAFNLYSYSTDGTSKQVAVALPDADSSLRTLTFDDQGRLYVYASGCRNIYQVDVDTETSEKLVTLPDGCSLMQCKNGVLMCMTMEKIFLYDTEKKSFIEDETLDTFIRDNKKGMEWTGGGYTAYAFLGADNTIYIAGDEGLYRHVIGGGGVECVIDAGLSSLGDPTNSIMAVTVNDRNEFLAAYSNGKIVRFAYDATVSSVPGNRITVYSLTEDELVRQTIAAYQTQYPDMYVEYQIGMDGGGVTREDALKKFNTQLLGGSGPDIIILDGMNIDNYVEKGVLTDLSDIVDAVDRQDGLYRNLIENLAVDSAMYAVPTKFYIPVLYGDEAFVGSVVDYPSMADMVERARKDYPDTNLLTVCSARGILRRSMPVCAPSWKDGRGQLDESKIREFFEQAKRIYDLQMNGTPQEEILSYQQHLIGEDGINYEESRYFLIPRDSGYLMRISPFVYGEIVDAYIYRDILSISRVQGLEGTVIKLMSGQSSNVYHPTSIAGISTAAKNVDAAKQFVSMMLGTTVQESMQFGIPVNKKALPAQFAYDESDLGEDGGQFYESFSTKDGQRYDFTVYPVEQDGIDRLESWIEELETPYLCDSVLEEIVYEEGAKYLEGTQDIDAAVKAVVDSVEIYLYE